MVAGTQDPFAVRSFERGVLFLCFDSKTAPEAPRRATGKIKQCFLFGKVTSQRGVLLHGSLQSLKTSFDRQSRQVYRGIYRSRDCLGVIFLGNKISTRMI